MGFNLLTDTLIFISDLLSYLAQHPRLRICLVKLKPVNKDKIEGIIEIENMGKELIQLGKIVNGFFHDESDNSYSIEFQMQGNDFTLLPFSSQRFSLFAHDPKAKFNWRLLSMCELELNNKYKKVKVEKLPNIFALKKHNS